MLSKYTEGHTTYPLIFYLNDRQRRNDCLRLYSEEATTFRIAASLEVQYYADSRFKRCLSFKNKLYILS